MNPDNGYDIAIVGGGLAGLALSIQVARRGYRVVVFEKEQYPFHKVCGEYISLESWDFLTELGLDLDAMGVSYIKKLQASSPNGKLLEQALPLGGFGISRYVLDKTLATVARQTGVTIEENARITDIHFDGESFLLERSQSTCVAKVVCGTFGKRSNVDIKWKRRFITASKNRLNNYIAVKYHVTIDFPTDTIALHTFKDGYCGIVKIEGDRYNLCYLTTAANLKKNGADIKKMEDRILSVNPHLQKILRSGSMLYDVPLTISQISFDQKSQVEHHVLMIGDAAGMITPLCGNGMSMALHGSKLAATTIDLFLQGKLSREEMEESYTLQWQQTFGKRLKMGRRIQRMLGNRTLTNFFIRLSRAFPGMVRWVIRQTHGERI